MALQEQIVVQPYVRGPKGVLKPEPAIVAKTGEAGQVRAERMLAGTARIVGVEVVRMAGDPESGDYDEPIYLVRLGEVPDLAN